MSTNKKRKVTIGLFVVAGGVAAVALALAASNRPDLEPPATKLVRAEPPPARPIQPPAVPDEPQPPQPATEPPQVDVVFALDTTGSMAGLIEGAKRKIWSIANQVLSGQPRPHVRIGLIGYRDIGDEYVTRRHDLTEDIDDVYRHLQDFKAAGGGDTPEHVNQALAEAIRLMQWRQGDRVLRQIYLVGDAPPHEGRSGLYSDALAREAAKNQILINTVRCGTMEATAVAWTRIAHLAGGLYTSIRQDGNMYAVTTPMDRQLAELNARLSRTLLPTGGAAVKRAARRRVEVNASMAPVAQAESATYRARSGRIDSADLLTQLERGKKLSSFDAGALPAPLARMSDAERQAYVDKVARERRQLREEIAGLATKREAYIKAKRASAGRGTGFDDEVGRALKKQGTKAGIAY